MNRKQRRASLRGTARPIPSHAAPAAGLPPLAESFRAAVALHQSGALAEAEGRYRHILTLYPDHAETHGMLGVALIAQRRTDEAVTHFERMAALQPHLAGPHDDLAKAYMAAGRPELAIRAAARALELGENERRRTFFAHCAKFVMFHADDGRFARLMARALTEAWARPRELTHACISLIRLDRAVSALIETADRASPNRVTITASDVAALARNTLLLRVLETDPIADLSIEPLMTSVRAAMLADAAKSVAHDSTLAFYCALARQCFINDYVYSTSEQETGSARRLRDAVEAMLATGEPCPAHWLAVIGSYAPLHTLKCAAVLRDRPWPDCIEALLVQQVEEPFEERRISATIPALTGIDDEVSRAVRQQYEESPYPRWTKGGPPGRPAILNDREPEQAFDVLIAGCGTGLSATEFARCARGARILAIDLSLASLSYAKRMALHFGLTNIEFAQADILQLGTIDRQFDFIDAAGVLHHLADPCNGWRILLSLLRPGGTMEVGLYSEHARRQVVAGRELIARKGYRPVPDDIRACREAIAAAEDGSLLKSLTRSVDFFSMSECRDLLFHPQEHRLTLPDIKAFLAANGLEFMGFALPPPLLHRFALRFPEPAALADLDRWHAFETEQPDTFAGMYLFTVRKPAASPAQTTAARSG